MTSTTLHSRRQRRRHRHRFIGAACAILLISCRSGIPDGGSEALFCVHVANAFVPPYPKPSRRCDSNSADVISSSTMAELCMAGGGKRRGGNGGGGGGRGGGGPANNNNSKKKNKKRRAGAGPGGKHRKTTKRDGPRGGAAGAAAADSSSRSAAPSSSKASFSGPAHNGIVLPSSSGRGTSRPPWQVMSAKDAKAHVQSELRRRQRIQLGLERPSDAMAVGGTCRGNNKADVSPSNALLSESDRSLLSWKRFNPDGAACGGMAYVGSYLGKRTAPPSLGVPEVAFLGRSNVGKSSLLNRLTEGVVKKSGGGGGGGGDAGRPADRARVGKTPGATAAVNLYAILGRPGGGGRSGRALNAAKAAAVAGARSSSKPVLGLADLPGFGYAKLSKDTKANVEQAAEKYLGGRRELALGVLLVDARRVPSDDDRAVLAALYDMGIPIVVAATKVDKLGSNALGPALEEVRDGLGLPDGQPLCVSSVTGEGTKDLWRIVLDACETRVEELKKEAEGKAASADDDEKEEEEFFEDSDDLEYDQGYDWIQIFGEGGQYYGEEGSWDDDEDDEYDNDDDDNDGQSESRWKMTLNEERQAADNEAQKLRNLKKIARRLERKGEV